MDSTLHAYFSVIEAVLRNLETQAEIELTKYFVVSILNSDRLRYKIYSDVSKCLGSK
jgi:hypothetical protein